MNLFYWCTG